MYLVKIENNYWLANNNTTTLVKDYAKIYHSKEVAEKEAFQHIIEKQIDFSLGTIVIEEVRFETVFYHNISE